MSVSPGPARVRAPALELDGLGELAPIGRAGGQGRVYQPSVAPGGPGALPLALKLYRCRPPAGAFEVLASMIAWARELPAPERARLHEAMAWPLAILTRAGEPVGIAMQDLRPRFEVPFVMPSGRRTRVLLSLEHLLGADDYLQLRGLDVRLTTRLRVHVAERVAAALALAHRHGIAVCDISPANVLVAFSPSGSDVCLIDCDSMVFRGVAALPAVQTADWQLPDTHGHSATTRAADVYKLGLVVLRLLARCHDARDPCAHRSQIPEQLGSLLERTLAADPTNRPAAGEWERALRELGAWSELDRRHPGPAPPLAPGAAPALGRNAAAAPALARNAAAALAVSAGGSTGRWGAPSAPAGRTGAQRNARGARSATGPLVFAWVLVMAVLLMLLISRMLAAAPGPASSGFAGGSAAFGQGGAQYYYVVPPGQGPGSTTPQLP